VDPTRSLFSQLSSSPLARLVNTSSLRPLSSQTDYWPTDYFGLMRFRSIPSVLVIGYREAVALLIGGSMALLFGFVFAIGGAGALKQECQFLTNSTTGVAEIIGKERVGQNNFYVDCRLTLNSSEKLVYQTKISVYSGLWQNLRKGQALDVEYLRNDPANMRLPGSIGNLADTFLHLLFGMFLVIVGTIATVVGVRVLVREKRRQSAQE